MSRVLAAIVASTIIAAPANAAEWQNSIDTRTGAFVGARLQMSLGGKTARPRAALAIAPTRSTISGTGMIRTNIGDGVALNFGQQAKPTLTLAGVRADTALGLRRDRDLDSDKKLGVSSGGWVAVALGSAAIIAGGLYLAADHIADCDEGECD